MNKAKAKKAKRNNHVDHTGLTVKSANLYANH